MKNIVLSLFIIFGTFVSHAQQTVGVFQNTPEAFPGYTLFNPLNSFFTYLIDNCGQRVNIWSSSYPVGNSVYLLEDGHLLRTRREGSSEISAGGAGGGIELIDWSNNLIWEATITNDTMRAHHDIERLPNGNILVLAWELKHLGQVVQAGRDPAQLSGNGIWMEFIYEIKPILPSGFEVVWEWHLFDHLVQDFDPSKDNFGVISAHPELLDINYTNGNYGPDWTHANSIDYNAERDEILMSFRYLNEIYIIDHSTTSLEAASHQGGNQNKGGDFIFRYGNPIAYDQGTQTDQQLFQQHDATWIPTTHPDGGKILIFNNGNNRPGGSASSVDIINPVINNENAYTIGIDGAFLPSAPEWAYMDPIPNNFYSSYISGAQRLPNGNTLICSGSGGRFFEINSNKNIVWEYVNPAQPFDVITQGNPPGQNAVFRAERYPIDYVGFNGLDLTPGNPIENNPLDNCEIFTNVVEIEKDPFFIFPNPTKGILHLPSDYQYINSKYDIFNMEGQLISSGESQFGTISVETLNRGLYFLRIENKVTRFIKY